MYYTDGIVVIDVLYSHRYITRKHTKCNPPVRAVVIASGSSCTNLQMIPSEVPAFHVA